MKTVYLFNWPSHYGGADTKVAHLIKLLGKHIPLVVVASTPDSLKQAEWVTYIQKCGARVAYAHDLAPDPNGLAISICNPSFLAGGLFNIAIKHDWPIIWSSEMMWKHEFEDHVLGTGQVAKILYVSECQKSVLNYEAEYDIPTQVTGNFVDPNHFPFLSRPPKSGITIGRLSRSDLDKFPEDFPVFYEALEIPDVRFRVMAWSEELAEKYAWHDFGSHWELLSNQQETAFEFLQTLDLFVYPLGHLFTESWGRSTVEAMLTGAIPLVPSGHNFNNLIVHGESGFICDDFLVYRENCHRLADDPVYRQKISAQCRDHAVNQLCNEEQHRELWMQVLNV